MMFDLRDLRGVLTDSDPNLKTRNVYFYSSACIEVSEGPPPEIGPTLRL